MKNEIKTIDRVVEYFGTAYKAAQTIGVKHQQFYAWQKKGFIPFKRGKQIEELTQGAVTASEVWNEAGKYH